MTFVTQLSLPAELYSVLRRLRGLRRLAEPNHPAPQHKKSNVN